LAPTDAFPRTSPIFAAVKGIINAPCTEPAMRPENRDALLDAIAKARGWIVRPPPRPDRCEVFKEFEPWERYALMPITYHDIQISRLRLPLWTGAGEAEPSP
jgi:hypothetical protein